MALRTQLDPDPLGRFSTRSRQTGLAVVGILSLLVVWQFVAIVWFSNPSGAAGAIPPPYDVLVRVAHDLVDPAYWRAVGATSLSALIGYGIGTGIAVFFGVVVMLVPTAEKLAMQLGIVSACLPVAAIAPIVVLLTPTGSRLVSITIAALAVQFPMIVGVLLGLRATSPNQIDLIRAYGGSEFMVIRKVRAISAIPSVLAALKIGAPSAFLGAIVGEFFAVGVDSGAGRLLLSLQYVGDYVGMWAIALISTGVSSLAYISISLVGRALGPWTASTEKGVAS